MGILSRSECSQLHATVISVRATCLETAHGMGAPEKQKREKPKAAMGFAVSGVRHLFLGRNTVNASSGKLLNGQIKDQRFLQQTRMLRCDALFTSRSGRRVRESGGAMRMHER